MKKQFLFWLAPLALVLMFLAACGGGGQPQIPANPTGFTATPTGPTAIALAWQGASGAQSYSLERRIGDAAFTEVATLPGSARSYDDTGLTAVTTYEYRLRSRNGVGASAGVLATATTPAPSGDGGGDGGGDGNGVGDGDGSLFTLRLNPTAQPLIVGTTEQVTVNVVRKGGFSGGVALSLSGAVVGAADDQIAATFTPALAEGGSSALTLTAGPDVAPGAYDVVVRGSYGQAQRTATLRVTVTAPVTVLLVDDDRSDNNYYFDDPTAQPSASDTSYRKLLGDAGIRHDVYVVRSDGAASGSGPAFDVLSKYETVIWYTGDENGPQSAGYTLTSTDEVTLGAWLDAGGRRLVLVAAGYFYDHGYASLEPVPASAFAATHLGLTAGRFDNNYAGANATLAGVSGQATAGMSMTVSGHAQNVDAHRSTALAAAGTDALLTYTFDPEDEGGSRPVPIATRKAGAGAAGTSVAVFVGFPLENIVDIGANSKAALLGHLLGR